MLLTGFVWLFIGASVITDNNINLEDAILYQVLFTREVVGAAWIIAGVGAMLASLRGSTEKYGFAILVIMPLVRVIGNAYGFMHYLIPGYPPGTVETFWNVLVWGSIGLVIYVIAGWTEDTERTLG